MGVRESILGGFWVFLCSFMKVHMTFERFFSRHYRPFWAFLDQVWISFGHFWPFLAVFGLLLLCSPHWHQQELIFICAFKNKNRRGYVDHRSSLGDGDAAWKGDANGERGLKSGPKKEGKPVRKVQKPGRYVEWCLKTPQNRVTVLPGTYSLHRNRFL